MRKKGKQVVPEDIHLLHVNVIHFCLEASENYLEHPLLPGGTEISIGKEIGWNFEQGRSRYRLHFHFEAKDEEKKSLGLTADVGIEYLFEIKVLNTFLSKKGDAVQVDIALAGSLMNIAYGTSRGIVLAQTRNTYFNGILLPVIDVMELLKEPPVTSSK